MSASGGTLAEPQLDLNGRKGRYGVAVLDTLVTAAGYDMTEPRPGADMLAYDSTVSFPEGDVRVQIKTTHKYSLGGSNSRLTYSATDHWIESWSQTLMPVYFVVIVVPKGDSSGWHEHVDAGTMLRSTGGFWNRIRAADFADGNRSVAALRSQRLGVDSVEQWRRELLEGYGL